jgi:signal transduction histidine kinase
MRDRQGYRGPDRRWGGADPVGTPLAVATAVLAAIMIPAALYGGRDTPLPSAVDPRAALTAASGATVAIGMVAANIVFLRWRLVGDIRALRISAGVILYAVVVAAMTGLLPFLAPDHLAGERIGLLRAAGSISALAWFAFALAGPAVDTRARPWRTVAGMGATLTGATALLSLLPDDARRLAGPATITSGPTGLAMASAVMGGWLLFGVAAVFSGIRRRQGLHVWIGLMGFAFAAATASYAGATSMREVRATTGAVLTLAGVTFALLGASNQLRQAYVRQRGDLHESRVEAETAVARLRSEHAAEAERAHEARNALLAIQGAAFTLERSYRQGDETDRANLVEAIGSEIERLQRLVAAQPDDHGRLAFDVATALAPVLACEASSGTPLDTAFEPDLVATGSPAALAEVVQNLLTNARVHAPGSPVLVRGERFGDGVHIRVEDQGPGIPASFREQVFERRFTTRREGTTPGFGLGLTVARRLMREQGGDLWVEERPGGGAAFVAALPGPAGAALGGSGLTSETA